MEALSNSHRPPQPRGTNEGYLDTIEAAVLLRLAQRTLERHRLSGTGPIFMRLGRRVLYHPDDLRAWAQTHRYRSTSEPTIQPASTPPKPRRSA